MGLGIPIPILNEEMAWFTGVADEDIQMPVVDYGEDYPNGYPSRYGHVSFADLKKGVITVEGKEVPTTPDQLQPVPGGGRGAEKLDPGRQIPSDRSPGTHPREVSHDRARLFLEPARLAQGAV